MVNVSAVSGGSRRDCFPRTQKGSAPLQKRSRSTLPPGCVKRASVRCSGQRKSRPCGRQGNSVNIFFCSSSPSVVLPLALPPSMARRARRLLSARAVGTQTARQRASESRACGTAVRRRVILPEISPGARKASTLRHPLNNFRRLLRRNGSSPRVGHCLQAVAVLRAFSRPLVPRRAKNRANVSALKPSCKLRRGAHGSSRRRAARRARRYDHRFAPLRRRCNLRQRTGRRSDARSKRRSDERPRERPEAPALDSARSGRAESHRHIGKFIAAGFACKSFSFIASAFSPLSRRQD